MSSQDVWADHGHHPKPEENVEPDLLPLDEEGSGDESSSAASINDDHSPAPGENIEPDVLPLDEEGSDVESTTRRTPDEETPSPPSADEKPAAPPAPNTSEPLTTLYTVSYLTLFSLLGTLARLGLAALTTYPLSPVPSPMLWPNAAGSFIIGFLAADTRLFSPHPRRRHHSPPAPEPAPPEPIPVTHRDKKTVPLYVGLATGFCGSFTSFSTFQRDVFLALTDAAPPIPGAARSPGQSFLALLASLILTPAVCMATLQVGAHLAGAMKPRTPTVPADKMRRYGDKAAVPVAALCWLGVVFMAIWPPDRPGGPEAAEDSMWAAENWRGQVLFALVLAPPGCLLRWYASLHLNGRLEPFPLGTFAVNIGGTLLEAMLWDLQHSPLPAAGALVGGGRTGCQVLQGAMDGFCGCLTTVSTWVAELKGLGRRKGYVYGAASLAAGLVATVVVMGSLKWTLGFAETACTS